jgi:anaerobic selenocysteine-containing dehydrogenase
METKMIRRNFIRLMTLAGMGSVPVLQAATKSNQMTIHYKVTGFTCITCAVGLDAMLQREKGVVWSQSSYQDARTCVCFHPDLTNDEALRNAIADLGFVAEKLG